MDNWKQLNTVRLILASAVAVSHANYIFLLPLGYVAGFPVVQMIAKVAVLLFFVLSGFIIGRSLQFRRDGLLRFLARRSLRIFPPLVTSFAVVALLSAVLDLMLIDRSARPEAGLMTNAFEYNHRQFFGALVTFGLRGELASPANPALWSLTLELQCYLAIGLIAQLFVTTSAMLRMGTLFALALVTLRIFYGASHFWPYYSAFFAGSFMSLWINRLPKFLPSLSVDFSYSLFIMHFPIMLAFFFVFYTPTFPSTLTAILIGALASAVSVVVALASARWVESLRRLLPPISPKEIRTPDRSRSRGI
ncbi:acyltransferase [Bradyrhizobium sp. sBnM-33]|uniref:acyltransferase family protein n=1 Tax=Bradyrhizobium sp. sBnM-33 TaxID=2831780 RepID=UPI001BCC9995|nr:acyltransferase family protein [Bradyrhizobium sp. sBnM-33]WOH53894.1 acyltransferase family protein [Bradyrhizobium sp. sBnM-33]